jgi:uncharacterized protein
MKHEASTSVSIDAPPHAPSDENPIAAGEFSAWLRGFQASLRDGTGNDVACGDCVGCCTSSYFIHVGPQERECLKRIPPEAGIPAPGMPRGHLLLGYKPDGRCPMLGEDRRCTIYPCRPETCRAYDCRIFAAAGITAGGADKSVINERVKRWKFEYATEAARRVHRSVKQAARFIRANAKLFPGGRIPTEPSQLALLAIEVHPLFLDPSSRERTDAQTAQAIVERSRSAT